MKIKVQAAFLALCFTLCGFRFVFFAFGHTFQRYQRGAFVQINQADTGGGTAGFAHLFHFGADEHATGSDEHQIVRRGNEYRTDQFAISLAGVDGDDALAAPALAGVVGNRRAFAVAVLGGGEHLQIAADFGGEQADDAAVFRQPHAAQAAAAASAGAHAFVGLQVEFGFAAVFFVVQAA